MLIGFIVIYWPIAIIIRDNPGRNPDPVNGISEPMYQPQYTPEEVLYQPMALFPVQMLPYQYYQVQRGKFLLPTAYSLATFFTPPFPFSEPSYKESGFFQPAFQEKGEYAT